MSRDLVLALRANTEAMLTNAAITLKTCDTDYILCGMPIWKHIYHMLHSCDRWYINPNDYTEPDFHVENLNNLDVPCEKTLSREELTVYLAAVREKILAYLDTLDDAMLTDILPGCKQNRLGVILSQFRHFYAHIGMINATTIVETNEWPLVVGIYAKLDVDKDKLYE